MFAGTADGTTDLRPYSVPRSSSTIRMHSMPNILASHQKDNHLGYVRRMVGDSFQVLRNEYQLEGTRNRPRIFQHICECLAKDLLVHVVHHFVIDDDLFC